MRTKEDRCPSGKRIYESRRLAEEALVSAWSQYDYRTGNGPIAIYQCEDCGDFHLTSKGDMDPALKSALDSGDIARRRQGNEWEQKLKGKP